MTEKTNIFPQLIKEVRARLGITQRELAQMFDPPISHQSVALWEKGRNAPAKKYWVQLAKFSNLEIEELVARVEGKSLSYSSNLDEVVQKIQDLPLEGLEIIIQAAAQQWEKLGYRPGSQEPKLNKQQLALLKRGATVWNRWREQNPYIIPQLSRIDFSEEGYIDLSDFNLDDANLAEIEGSGMKFEGASLVRANLSKAKLRHTSFNKANLSEANLTEIELSKVHLDQAKLLRANLTGATIRRCWISEANLEQANLQRTQIRDVYFNQSRLVKVNFTESHITLSNFAEANLNEGDLTEANITLSNFTQANFNEANFEKAVMRDCQIYGISTWGVQAKDARFEKLFIYPQEHSDFCVDDLILAPTTYLERYNQEKSEKILQQITLKNKVIELAQILVKKYGDYSHTEGFRIYRNLDVNAIGEPGGYYQVLQREDSLRVSYQPNYHKVEVMLDETQTSRELIWSKDGLIESDLRDSDLRNLETLLAMEDKTQNPRFKKLMSIIDTILETEKTEQWSDDTYQIEVIDNELIVCTHSEHKIELMRARKHKGKWEMVNSSISNDMLNHFERL